MAISKVIYGGDTLIDITDSTIESNNMLNGTVGYNSAGERTVGSAVIPTVNDSTITIKENGSTVDTFTLNQSSDKAIDIPVNQSYYGTCTDNGDVVAKSVTVSNQNFKLAIGAVIGVRFSKSNSASNVTLNVNDTGDKSIYYNNYVFTGTSPNVCGFEDRINYYMYDGTYWVWLNTNRVIDTTYSTMAANEVYTGTETTAKIARADRLKTDVNKLIDDKINALDGGTIGTPSTSKTVTALSESNGNINATFSDIQIGESQVTNLTTDLGNKASSTHTHGNITNDGKISSDVTIANGDKLLITDSSDSNKVVTSSITFNGSTDTQCLTRKGTWANFTNNSGTITKVTTSAGAHTAVDISSGAVSFNVPTKTSHLTNDSGFLTAHQTIEQDGITGAEINRFGTCGTAAATAAKTVSITAGTFALAAGSIVTVKFTNANTANNPTLNVNSKGAKNIWVNGARITSGANKALLQGTVVFVYDGTQWNLIGNYYDTDTTYTVTNENIGVASKGNNIAADDITAWTTNTPTAVTKKTVVTSATYANGILTISTGDSVDVTAGTAASLDYTARSIPNISVSSKSVVTSVTAN